jgi:hypothetical protein
VQRSWPRSPASWKELIRAIRSPEPAATGPTFLDEEDAAKIDGRLDEAYRRKMIEAKA